MKVAGGFDSDLPFIMRTTKTFSVTVPIDLVPEIERAARAQCRSRSSFLAWLIRKDQITQEDRSANIKQPPGIWSVPGS
jgi:hypothetical protein